MSDNDTGLSKILGNFQRFAGGIEARPAQTVDTEQVVSQAETTFAVPHINGQLPGEVAGVDFWIPLVQLQLAPAEDLLNNRYDPKEDPEFEQYKAALAALGDSIPSLPILPAQRDLQLPDGSFVPQYLIYDMPYVYYALIDLKRVRAKVYFPAAAHPGAILLSALGREGQLRREPSIIEVCRAAKRLKTYYGYTLIEIGEQQAANREDRSRPSESQIHYQINVASLPETVQDMLHRKRILWTHARDLAETFLGDDVLCEQLAILASQGKRMSVEDFVLVLKRVKGNISSIEQDPDDGVVREIRRDQVLKLVADRESSSRSNVVESVTYDRTMVARPALIHRESSRFRPIIVPNDKPELVALAPGSFEDLRTWINERQTNTSIRDTEAVLLGFLQAVRASARLTGIVNAQGAIAPQVDAKTTQTDTGS